MRLVDVTLPLGLDGSTKIPKTRTALVNCWNAEDIINRPGIAGLNTTGLVARGQFVWNENLYQVVSTDLIKITDTETGDFSVIGTIAGTADIDFAIGFNEACIIVKGGNGYTLDNTDTLVQMVSPQFVASVSVTHMNGRFIFVPSDGSPAFFSDVGAADTIQSGSFFDAEELPDKNTVCFNFRNILYIGGTDSFELFQDSGVGTVPYVRLNARIDYGFVGGILQYGDTFIFVGREKDQDIGIYAIDRGKAVKLSNELIDTILIDYTPTQLANINSNRLKWIGYDIATFKLPSDSFGFYKGNWFTLTTQVDNEAEPWEADFITQFDLKYYVAHDDKIGVFEDIPTDFGNSFEGTIDLGFEEDGYFTVNSLTLNISQGFNDSLGSVALQLSHDNVLYTEPFYRQTGSIGEYAKELTWKYPGGLGYYQGFMGIRLTTTENINFSVSKLTVDI
jgi:hypothetical protein